MSFQIFGSVLFKLAISVPCKRFHLGLRYCRQGARMGMGLNSPILGKVQSACSRFYMGMYDLHLGRRPALYID